jgi:hypothetical protein
MPQIKSVRAEEVNAVYSCLTDPEPTFTQGNAKFHPRTFGFIIGERVVQGKKFRQQAQAK